MNFHRGHLPRQQKSIGLGKVIDGLFGINFIIYLYVGINLIETFC